jgi:DtxR family Mn-dependent transcriptional regulator
MLSTSIEDYIKAIYSLELEEHRATTKRIADRLGVKMASVTGMVKHIAAEGYARHKPYYGVQLTERGKRIALDMIRRHRLIELFLSKTLGLGWDEVDADAEVLEHAVGDRLIERIYDFLGQPEFDPHGAPIPALDGTVAPHPGVPLSELSLGERGRVVEVSDDDPEFLRYLTKMRIKIGSRICVIERAPFGGPVVLDLGAARISIGPEACGRIRVDKTQSVTSSKPGKQKRTRAPI